MSDSEEEQVDLTSKFGLGDASDSGDESGSGSSDEEPTQYQDEIIYSDEEDDNDDAEEEEDNKKKEKASNPEDQKMPNLELSDDENDDNLNDLISTNLLPSAKKAKSGTFQSFGLSKKILHNIGKKGYKQPTPIQRKSIPFIISGRDIVGMARTGSGKTAAFLLPIIEKLKTHSAKVGTRCVILSPNRELALQTFKSFKDFSKGTGLRAIVLVGGDSLEDQFSSMLQNPDVIIATPGRFLHLRTEMSLDLKSVQYIVFDEADQLFEVSFEEQLNELIASLSPNKQAILFSATLPKTLVNFAKIGLNNPVLIRLDSETKISDQLEMCFVSAKQAEREANLLYIIQEVIKMPQSTPELIAKLDEFKDTRSLSDSDSEDDEADDKGKKKKYKKKKFNKDIKFAKANELVSPNATIVFVPTRHHVEYIKNFLTQAGHACSYIYGSLDQRARRRQLFNFKAAITSLLVVTDVAARGIDIPLLKYVINYTLPASSKLFVHRVGRTARAGNTGFAYSIVTPNEVPSLVEMELFLGRKILLTGMHNKKKELLKQKCEEEGVEYTEPKVSYSDRLVLGSAPRRHLETMMEFSNALLKDYELQVIKKVAEKAEKLYYKSKAKVTSVESLKRSKELLKSGWDEQNLLFGDDEEKEKESFLLKLQNRRNKETVFEFNKKNEKMIEFMNKRRRQIASIQQYAKERDELLEKERLAGLSHSLQDEVLKGDNYEVGFNIVASEGEIKDAFENADDIIESEKNSKKKKKRPQSYKDPTFFMSHYAPTSDIQDKQYDIPTSYANDAQKATFDLAGDDNVQVHKQTQVMQWSKSKKNYVNSRSTDEKFIIGESGQRIPASYKSGRFEAWKNDNRISSMSLKVGAKESQAASSGGQRFKHKQNKAPRAPDRFRDDYHKQKKKVEAALDKGMNVKGFKAAGRASTNEIRSTENIRKERAQKQQRREKNGRPSKKRKF
ncbi:putative ATP-dependent RNA helicase [Saccharomycopsis crataegensis]|uniref:ATP-dependent RNA helicase DBP10 n=1 Tax=Saccharomycopsis crataegensis TaxID=43959 RepID=A0AAV5QWC4_9ASCO|nr:putative ATP-dependent RNA helicase [Saccharomycopsis crataegensis]